MAKRPSKKTTAEAAFPSTVYAGWNNPLVPAEKWMSTAEDPCGACGLDNNDSNVVAEYALVRVVKVETKTTTTLVRVK